MMNEIDTISMNVAINKERRYTERILGSTEHSFHYHKLHYSAEYQVPNNFDPEEKILCKLLYQNPLSSEAINEQLGLSNVVWLRDFMQNTLTKLLLEQLIDENDGIYSLTPGGEEAVLNGYKSRLETKDCVTLYYFQELRNIGQDYQLWKEPRHSSYILPRDFMTPNIEDIDLFRQLAAEQCPEIHCPQNGYILMRLAENRSSSCMNKQDYLDFQIFLLHDFATSKVRAIAYDTTSGAMLPTCSKTITEDEELMATLCQEILKKQQEQDSLEIGQFKKNKTQIDKENKLIMAGEADSSNFSPLEFEEELCKIFNEKHETIVIFSPWIKRSAQRLLPLFRTFLNNGGNLYLCYSETEGKKADENDFQTIQEIERLRYVNDWSFREYPKSRFMLTRDKPFHQKWVFVIDKDSKVAYSGSYNILSFRVNQQEKTIRQEDMNKIKWCARYEQKYQEILEKTRQ